MFVTPLTFQLKRLLELKLDASSNIPSMVDTDDVSHCDKSPLKLDAPLNIYPMFATEDVSQFEMLSELKLDEANIPYMFVTEDVSHSDKSPLKSFCASNIRAMTSVDDVSHPLRSEVILLGKGAALKPLNRLKEKVIS